MVTVKVVGSSLCRRYQRMLSGVTQEAGRLGIEFQVEEINDAESLAQFNPLSLPRLYIGEELVATANPPKPEEIARALQKMK